MLPLTLPRPCKRWLCAWVAVALLLMQSLALAQACPALAPAAPALPHAQHCQELDALLGMALCKAHCSSAQPAPAATALPDLPHACELPPLAQLAASESVTPVQRGGLVAETLWRRPPRAAAPPGWPPLYLTHGVLRI